MTPISPPSEAMLIAYLLRRLYGASLRELAEEVWPHLAWRPLRPGDLSVAETRLADGRTPAELLLDQLEALVDARQVRHVRRRRDEVDVLASIAFEVRRFCPAPQGEADQAGVVR